MWGGEGGGSAGGACVCGGGGSGGRGVCVWGGGRVGGAGATLYKKNLLQVGANPFLS